MSVRCLIVDDSRDFLRVASDLLAHDGISVVGVASTAAEAGQACGELRPDVVLIDIDLGEDSGLEVARQLAGQISPDKPRVVLISAHSAVDFAEVVADTLAVSFLPKSAPSGSAILGIVADTGGLPGDRLS